MVFGRNFGEKRQIWASERYFGEIRDDARPWLMACWKAHGRLSVRLIELFRYLLRFRSYKAKCVQLGCFHRGRPLCTQLLRGHGRPPTTILGIPFRKIKHWITRRRRPHLSAFSRFDTTPECDRQTDRQTDGRICSGIQSAIKWAEFNKLVTRRMKTTTHVYKSYKFINP